MRKRVSEALTDDTSTDPVIRRLLRKRALLQEVENLDRDFQFEIEHPASQLDPKAKPASQSEADSIAK